MRFDPFYSFRSKLHEQEQVAADESDLEKVLNKSPKVRATLAKLLTSQSTDNDKANKELRDVIGDIKIISFKPTTFRVIFKNSNYFDLIYDPTPQELENPGQYEPSDFFRVAIVGKRYDLSNRSSWDQVLDYIGQCMKYNPIDSSNPDEQQAATSDEEPAKDGEVSDLPDKTDKQK